MTAHQCPKCVLRFAWMTELRWHLREEHPNFHVGDYPVAAPPPQRQASAPPAKDKQT